MMTTIMKDRRAAIVGGVGTAAGIAVWMTLGGELASLGADAVRVVDGMTGKRTFAKEQAAADALIGSELTIRGEGGSQTATIAGIEAFAIRGAPAAVRATGYLVDFATDAAALAGNDGVVALSRPILGLDSLFVTRGLVRQGRSVLTAVIA